MPKRVIKKEGIAETTQKKKTVKSLKENPLLKNKTPNNQTGNKKTEIKNLPKKSSNTTNKSLNIEKTLVENFVGLQKVMTNMVLKLDVLSNQISELLNLFEVSAKTLAEKGGIPQGGIADKRLLEKVDNILEQNRTIARGISLLHEPPRQQQAQPRQQYETQRPPFPNQPPQREDLQYQKSISSKPQNFKPV